MSSILPALVKTWQFNVNQSIGGTGVQLTDYQSFLRAIVTTLTGFGTNPWTVDYSCDGTTAGTKGDAVNRWSTNAKVVFTNAGEGNTHSWMVLKNAALSNAELMITCAVTNTGGQIINISWSNSAGYTGGTTTNSPSATDQAWVPIPGTSGASTTNNNTNANGASTFTGKMHGMMSTDGTCTRIIACVGSKTYLYFAFEKLVGSVPSALTNPVAVTWLASASAAENLTYANAFRTNGMYNMYVNAGWRAAFPTCEAVNGSEYGNGQQYANDLDGTYPIMPVGLAIISGTGSRGRNGAFADLFVGDAGLAIATNYPGDASKQFVQFGCYIFPWNGTTAQTS